MTASRPADSSPGGRDNAPPGVPVDELAAILTCSSDAIIRTTLDGIISAWSPAAERLYGYTAREAIGRTLDFIIPSELPDDLPWLWKQVHQGQRVDEHETLRLTRDGRRIAVSLSVAPLHDAQGQVVGAVSVARDIREPRRLHMALREREEQFTFALEAAEVGTWEWELASDAVRLSPTLERIHGLPAGTFAGTAEAYLDLVHVEDRERVEATLRQATADGTLSRMSYRIVLPSGKERWIIVRGRAQFDAGGRPTRMIGVAWDNTERRELRRAAEAASQRLVNVLESMNDGFMLLDRGGRYAYVNRQAEVMFGRSREELLGKTVREAFPQSPSSGIYAQGRRAWQTGQEQIWEEFSTADGRWYQIRYLPAGDQLALYVQDITERKRAELELASTAQRFRALIERSLDAIALYDRTGKMIYASPSTPDVIGYTAEEYLQLDLRNLLHPDDRQAVEEALTALRTQPGGSVRFEVRARHRDGSWRWMQNVATNLLHDPAVRAVIFNYRDITEQRTAEAALRTSHEQLEAVLRSLEVGIIVQVQDGRLLYANDAAARLIGVASVEELRASDQRQRVGAFRVFDEAGRELPREELAGRLALATGQPQERLLRYLVVATGEERWSSVRAVPVLDAQGAVRFAVTAFQDVTQLKEAEASLRFLAEASAALAGSLDPEATPEEVARLTVQHLADFCLVHLLDEQGRLQQTTALHRDPAQQTVLERALADWREQFGETILAQRVLERSQPLLVRRIPPEAAQRYAPESQMRTSLELLAPRSYIAVPLVARGRIIGALSLVNAAGRRAFGPQDVVVAEELGRRAGLAIDNARLYREARQALAEAEAALAVRTQFLSVASHELRTPLTALRGHLELSLRRLDRGRPPQELREGMGVALHQVDRLSRLVGELLDVSRLAGGRFALVCTEQDLTALLRRVVELERTTRPERSIELQLPARAVRTSLDADRIEQVLVNLLENAHKYSPEEQPVRVRLIAGRSRVRILVEDRGIGIPLEDLPRVFEPFHRAGNVDRGVSGLGLGLYIAREIARLHGGDLTVTSTAGAGSVFTVELPRTYTAVSTRPTVSSRSSSAKGLER